MQEDQRPQQPSGPETVTSKIKESKIRMGENTPSRFGETKEDNDLGLPSGIKDVKDSTSGPLVTGSVKFPPLQAALKSHYSAQGSLQLPLSGKDFPIKDVSLSISDKSEQDQQEKARQLAKEKAKDAEEDKETQGSQKGKRKEDAFWSSRFRLEEEWHRISKPVAVKDVFTIENSTTPVRRILVEGRAGVGKTTFSQYVAHQWAQQHLFAGQFDYVFWLPLRQCLSTTYHRDSGNMEAHIAAFIYRQQISASEHIPMIEKVLSAGENSRTLLILDGFDEVAGQLADSDQPFYVILGELLRFPNLIITTRDYQTPPSQYKFDRRLVNVGFTDEQISAYIQSYYVFSVTPTLTLDQEKKKEDKYETSTLETKSTSSEISSATEQAKRMEAALKQNPRFWGLAHIPLNLALICESWPSLTLPTPTGSPVVESPMKNPPKTKTEDSKVVSPLTQPTELNLTALYQNVLVCFLKRDMQKQAQSSTTPLTWEALSESYALELLSLGAIAWQGMQAQQQILDAYPLTKALALIVSDYLENEKSSLEEVFRQALALGFVRHDSNDEKAPWLERRYYFIHLTFQEYFAAHYVLQTLQGRRGKDACQKMRDWLAQHKYEPRYAVLLSFLAGLTLQPGYDQALRIFWYTLLSPPYDVVGAQHLQLMVRCLIEARFDPRIPGRASLLMEIRQWVDAMVLQPLRVRDKDLPIALPWLKELLQQEPKLLNLCGWTLPKAYLKAAGDQHDYVQKAAIRALDGLGASLSSQPEALALVLKAAGDQNWYVREAAIEMLGGLGASLSSQPEALALVLKAAGNENLVVHRMAIQALGGLGASLSSNLEALGVVLKAAGDQDKDVRSAAIKALSGLSASLSSNLEALGVVLKAAGDQDKDVRSAAIKALSGLSASLSSNLEALGVVLKAAG